MKKKEGFQTSIRDYETIRGSLRNMYLYGCCTKEYMTGMGLVTSARKFDEDTRRIRAIIPERIEETLVTRKKSLRINVSALDIDENYLAASYFIKSFGNYDISIYFAVLLVLAETPGISFKTLAEKVNSIAGQDEILVDNTIRRFLSEMAGEGLIIKDKGGYFLPPDPLAEFTNKELLSLITAVDFYRNTFMLGILGEYIYISLINYARFFRRLKPPAASVFTLRYRHLERIVDDDTVFLLIHCIRTRKKARYKYKGIIYEGFPCQIRYDTFYGRQYAVINDKERSFILPVANISEVAVLPDIKDGNAEQDSYFRYSWFAAYPRVMTKPFITVRVWFYIDDSVLYLLERLQREKRHGNITMSGKGKYLFEINLSDPQEIFPWLRSFLGYAVIEKSNEHDLFEQYSDLVAKMREIYDV
jgi:hypothetical protein